MSSPVSRGDGHLPNDLLVQYIDDELAPVEAGKADEHLAHCASCRDQYLELRRVSANFDWFLESLRPACELSERQQLAAKLERAETSQSPLKAPASFRRAGLWGLAAAAALTVGVMYFPSFTMPRFQTEGTQVVRETNNAFEIDGETFVSLPFSNPELPVNSPRIVQMQVPVSSLAEAGIVLEPISNQVAAPDRSVLADVLLGLDGQPLAVHVLSLD